MNREVSYGISVSFTPWTSKEIGLSLISLKIKEELGGSLASGSAEFMTIESNIPISNMLTQYRGKITITKEGVGSIKIDTFVINRWFHKNSLFIEFVCIKDRRFFTDLKSLEYTDITKTIESLFPGNINLHECKSDINNDIPLKQFMETDQSFCTKLALSFKKNIVFAYGWEGFMIKDLKDGINSKGEKEEYDSDKKTITNSIVLGGATAEDMDYINIGYDHMRFVKSWDPWGKPEEDSNETDYSKNSPINSRSLKYYNNYITLGKDYYNLIENYLYNKQLLSSDLFASKNIIINDIPKFRLGDVITYKHLSEIDTDYPYKSFLVKSNTLHILFANGSKFKTGSGIKWESKLLSLVDSFGELLPETDITNKIYEN